MQPIINDPRLPRRFWDKVQPTLDGCWIWVGSVGNGSRYGCYWHGTCRADGRLVAAHRFAYEALVGPIDLFIDHLCRMKFCVNPAHLEVVSHRENSLRSDSRSAINARKTHCHRGHALSGDNLAVQRSHRGRPMRVCKTCRRGRYWAKKALLASLSEPLAADQEKERHA